MDTINGIASASSHPWDIYLFTILLLIALYFVQKYMYIIDRKLAQAGNRELLEHRKPWPLFVAILSGLLIFLYNVFSPNDLSFELSRWGMEWFFFAIAIITLAGIVYESIHFFGLKSGLLRTAVYVILMLPYFYAGMISGFLLVTIFVLGILLYFIRHWKKYLTIN